MTDIKRELWLAQATKIYLCCYQRDTTIRYGGVTIHNYFGIIFDEDGLCLGLAQCPTMDDMRSSLTNAVLERCYKIIDYTTQPIPTDMYDLLAKALESGGVA